MKARNPFAPLGVILAIAVSGTVPLQAVADEDEFEALEHDIIKLAMGRTKISMKQAIDAAVKEVGTAKLVEAELSVDADAAVFEFGFLTDSGGLEISVDASTGKVLKKEDEKPDADKAEEYKQTKKALSDARFSLLQAIDVAMNEAKGGTIVAAEAEVEDGQLGFEVEVLTGDEFKEVNIDASGKVTKIDVEKTEGQDWIFDRDEAQAPAKLRSESGKPPAGWKLGFTNPADGKATWTIAKDPKAMSGPNVLTLDAKSGGNVFNLAIAEKTSYQDVDVRTRIRANSGKEDQGGGLIWRAKDENDYYICRINPLESNFRVYKVVGGKRTQLQGVEHKAETGKWHVVRAKMVGNHIQCFVDGKKLLDVTDDTFKDAGMVGLWTKADASSSFDNIAVKPARATKDDHAAAKPADTGKKTGEHEDDEDGDE